MKRYLILPIFAVFGFSAAATSLPVFTDSSINSSRKPHKLNKEAFISMYGKDDSAKALIRYFFRRRSSGKRMILIPWGATAIAGPLLLPGVINNNSNSNSERESTAYFFFAATVLSLLAIATSALSIGGSLFLIFFSRKKLFKILNNYFNGKPMPRRYAKSKLFLMLMKGEEILRKKSPPNPFQRRHHRN